MMIGKQRRATGGEPVGGLRVHGLGHDFYAHLLRGRITKLPHLLNPRMLGLGVLGFGALFVGG